MSVYFYHAKIEIKKDYLNLQIFFPILGKSGVLAKEVMFALDIEEQVRF